MNNHLIQVGKPGTEKSLSLHILNDILKGKYKIFNYTEKLIILLV